MSKIKHHMLALILFALGLQTLALGAAPQAFDYEVSSFGSWDIGIQGEEVTGDVFIFDFENRVMFFCKEDLCRLVSHENIFNTVLLNLGSACEGLEQNNSLELVAEDLKNARSGFDELVGKKFSDSLLGDIFSSYCIGK